MAHGALRGSCPSCGAIAGPNANYCRSCGLGLAQAQPLPAPAPPPSVSPAPPQRSEPRRGVRRWRDYSRQDKRRAIVFLAVFYPVAGLLALLAVVLPSNGNPSPNEFSGAVFVAGPLQGATVDVYSLDGGGHKGALIGSGETDGTGHFLILLNGESSAGLLVTAAGGRYVDEATGMTTSTVPIHFLETVALPGSSAALLTPLTTFAAARALDEAGRGKGLALSTGTSDAAVAVLFNRSTITSVAPAVADDGKSVAASDWRARLQGIDLAGLDDEARSLGVSDLALTDAITADMSDGILDGKQGANPVHLGARLLPADAATGMFQQFAQSFANSGANVTGLHLPRVAASTSQSGYVLDTGSGGQQIDYCGGGVITFVEGALRSFPLSFCAGHRGPYSCSVTPPIPPPPGFSQDGCTITYDGRVVNKGGSIATFFGAGSTWFSTTWTVRLSGSSDTLTLHLLLAVLPKPPMLTLLSHGPCTVNRQCDLRLATGTGRGSTPPPYEFTGDVWPPSVPPAEIRADRAVSGVYAIPQLGLHVEGYGKIGYAAGTPHRVGTYLIHICLNYGLGFQTCGQTSVTVRGATTPTTSAAATSTIAVQSGSHTYHLAIQMSWSDAKSEKSDSAGYESLSSSGSGTLTVRLAHPYFNSDVHGSLSIPWQAMFEYNPAVWSCPNAHVSGVVTFSFNSEVSADGQTFSLEDLTLTYGGEPAGFTSVCSSPGLIGTTSDGNEPCQSPNFDNWSSTRDRIRLHDTTPQSFDLSDAYVSHTVTITVIP